MESIFDRFLMVFGAILGAKMVPKLVKKSIKKLMDFWKGSGAQKGDLTTRGPPLPGPRGGVRGGVNPPLRIEGRGD